MNLFGGAAILVIWSWYSVYCYSQYTETIRTSKWYPIVAITYSLVSSVSWVILSRKAGDPLLILKYALVWDSGICVIAFLIPILIFSGKLNLISLVGMTSVLLGTLLVLFSEELSSLIG